MNNTTIIWLVPLFCLLGSMLSAILFLAAIVNTARLERHYDQQAPAHRPREPQPAPQAPLPALQSPLPRPTHAHR